MIIHTVTNGDTIYSISKQYSVPESRIITDNFLDPTKKLTIGQTLIISRPCKTCAVRGGDTLVSIAERNNVSVLSLLQNNPQILTSNITPSQTLNIKYEKGATKSIIVAAYTGNASLREVEERLPYISMLNIQNAAYINGGEMSVLKNAEPLVSLASQYRAMPILSFDCADERGRWKSDCLDIILETPDATEKFIQSALNVVKNNGFAGIEMQLCCKNDSSKYKLHDMLLTMSGLFKEKGLVLLIPHLPDITNDDNAEVFNDIAELIPLWNYIWDDESVGSPAAPLDKTIQTLEKPILQPHLAKTLIGLPTFGVSYTPTSGGYRKNIVDAAEGLRITQRYPVSAEFDVATGSPFVKYNERMRGGELTNTIHYEDARSFSEKLNLIGKYGLAGVNIMSLEFSAPVLWQILNQRFNIIKY